MFSSNRQSFKKVTFPMQKAMVNIEKSPILYYITTNVLPEPFVDDSLVFVEPILSCCRVVALVTWQADHWLGRQTEITTLRPSPEKRGGIS